MDQLQQVEEMKEAYRKLYIIENTLRKFIINKLSIEYGENWEHVSSRHAFRRPPKKAFEEFYFHELVIYLNAFPVFKCYLQGDALNSFKNIFEVRNKIAHCKSLNAKDWVLLENAYSKIELLV